MPSLRLWWRDQNSHHLFKISYFSPIANCANISSLLYNRLRTVYTADATNWVGFYYRSGADTLQLGPFCGLPACQKLKFSKEGISTVSTDHASEISLELQQRAFVAHQQQQRKRFSSRMYTNFRVMLHVMMPQIQNWLSLSFIR